MVIKTDDGFSGVILLIVAAPTTELPKKESNATGFTGFPMFQFGIM